MNHNKIHIISFIAIVILGVLLYISYNGVGENTKDKYQDELLDRQARIDSLYNIIHYKDSLLSVSFDKSDSLITQIGERDSLLENVPKKYDEARGDIILMGDDESIRYLSNRLNN